MVDQCDLLFHKIDNKFLCKSKTEWDCDCVLLIDILSDKDEKNKIFLFKILWLSNNTKVQK